MCEQQAEEQTLVDQYQFSDFLESTFPASMIEDGIRFKLIFQTVRGIGVSKGLQGSKVYHVVSTFFCNLKRKTNSSQTHNFVCPHQA